MLAGHAFRLTGARPPSIIDQNGVMYFLKEGRNMVGRHPESVPLGKLAWDAALALGEAEEPLPEMELN